MSNGKPPPRTFAGPDRATLEGGVEKLGRIVKELRGFDVASLHERSDPRLDHLQRRANTLLADLLGLGTADYRVHAINAIYGSLDTTFGDHYSMDEFRQAVRKGIDKAVGNLNAARTLLTDKARSAAAPGPAPARAPAPTPAPTPAPAKASPEIKPMSPAPVSSSAPAQPVAGRRVLLLGQGGAAAEQAIALLAQLQLDAAVLDTPSVDRLDALRDAAFAIVVPSPDVDAPSLMLAVGFMLATLGRQRICVISDATQAAWPALQGALKVTPDESGLWRLLLAREMKRAGLDVDLNLAV